MSGPNVAGAENYAGECWRQVYDWARRYPMSRVIAAKGMPGPPRKRAKRPDRKQLTRLEERKERAERALPKMRKRPNAGWLKKRR
jgi:hypothetical protein